MLYVTILKEKSSDKFRRWFFTVTGWVGTYLLRETGLGNTPLGGYFKKDWVGRATRY